ncbi:MAG: integrase family protein [Burkholderiaceae bacterium]|nr:integrase family protein [Burkholderiaceae bacterium]
MARPSKTATIDYSVTHDLTHGLIERASCPEGLAFVLLKDADRKGLRLRITKAGGKHWQFETRLKNGKLFTRTLGEWPTISIPDARTNASDLRKQTEQGKDPREQEQQAREAAIALQMAAQAEEAAKQAIAAAQSITVGDLWPTYLTEGKPKRRDEWKPRYLTDLQNMSKPGGVKKLRGKGTTRPGPVFPLLALALCDVNEDTLKEWHDKEAKTSKHQAARALMMFRGFLRWCASKPAYRGMVDADSGKAPALLEALPSMKRRTDALEAAQVAGWWSGVEQLGNRTASVYLRALLLTGARREEIAALKWEDVDFRWRKLTIADKVESTRTIPLTPYLAQLLATLPHVKLADGTRSPFVFASISKTGRIADTRNSHAKALQSAGIEGLTIHGLRRSFSLLGEAAGAPAGAIAQVMGHKPSATAEGYRPRSVDALRPFLAQIEAHVLGLAGVQFDAQAEPGKLQLVAG